MSKLLINERPLVLLPQLATAIGLNEAVALQQIHYWLDTYEKAETGTKDPRHYHDGQWWVYNTAEGWQKNFPFWSISTIRRTLDSLRERGLVQTGNYNQRKYDRTLWYTIDYENLAIIESLPPSTQNDQMPSTQNDQMEPVRMSTPIPKSTSETTRNIVPPQNGGNVVTIEMEEDDVTITCPECRNQRIWPGTERERKTREWLTCPDCGAQLIVKGFKAFGGGPYTYTHPDVRKAQRQKLSFPLTAAFCRLAQIPYKGVSLRIKQQWEKVLGDSAGEVPTATVVSAIDGMDRIDGLANPYMFRFSNALVVALRDEDGAFTLDEATNQVTFGDEEPDEMVIHVSS
jgi:predicted RNA-binding Zn-ribbon protein involved in translation (DUF1610 family)